jgi:sulfatase maturation enzyme AslB (radical SAM superfamily)
MGSGMRAEKTRGSGTAMSAKGISWGMRLWLFFPARLRALLRAWYNPPYYPVTAQIEQTNRCNLKCVMCAHGHVPPDPAPDMTLETFQRLMDELPTVKTLHLQGLGEPMLNRDTPAMVEYAQSKEVFGSSGFWILTMYSYPTS